jgi:hypothetical protein
LVKRQHWRRVKNSIASLTVEQLLEAAKAAADKRPIEDPIVLSLLRDLNAIGESVPLSYSQKLKMRSRIKGLIARYGMPAFWLTINPSDLRNPLVLILAGILLPEDALHKANAAIRQAAATSNPVAVAQFFHHTCKALFDELLCSNTGKMGIFGQVSNHFGVVETNGRGMLHLHALVWVTGNVEFNILRDRISEDKSFAERMIKYLENIIIQSLHTSNPDPNHQNTPSSEAPLQSTPPSAKGRETDDEFNQKLAADSNAVAERTQLHSTKHNATCFKYRQKGQQKKTCRFGMPRLLRTESKVDKLGVIHLARNNAWVNAWNRTISA